MSRMRSDTSRTPQLDEAVERLVRELHEGARARVLPVRARSPYTREELLEEIDIKNPDTLEKIGEADVEVVTLVIFRDAAGNVHTFSFSPPA